MACREDDARIGFQACNGDFGGWRGAEADVEHICTHGLQCAANHLIHKESRKARIATHHDFRAFRATVLDEFHESGGEFHHVYRSQVIARMPPDGATNAGNGFD